MATGVECRLEGNTPDCRMPDREFYNSADFVFIEPPLEGGNDRDVEPVSRESIERPQLLRKNIRLAAYEPIGVPLEAVELEVQRGPHLVELLKESIVAGDALAVGVDHHEADFSGVCGSDEIDDMWVHGRLAAGKLHHLGPTFGPHVIVEHLLDFLEGQAKAGRRIGKAKGTIHVAGAVDLDDAEAGVLLVVRAKSTVVRAATIDCRAMGQRYRAGLVVPRERDVGLGIAV